jgi:hypothetical protein
LILLESYFRFGVEGGAVVDRKSDAKINEKWKIPLRQVFK